MNPLSALPSSPLSWTQVLSRRDVRLHRGILHLVHDDLTPHDALMADLTLVADAFDDAGVEHLLIRRDLATPALVVALDDADRAWDAVAALATTEPLYVKARNAKATPVTVHRPRTDAPSVLRVFRPRITGTHALTYGSRSAVRVEFWRFGDDLVDAPADNVLTRRVIPVADIAYTTVERYGRSWRTLDGMFDAHPTEFTEEVDMVFSWVDGSSSEFQRQRAAQLSEYVVGEGDEGVARYRHVDELRYALRSVHMYAPWVRRIFIATDSPPPAWLIDHPRVTLVRSEEFFADTSVLPIHNSHAVESQLHRIEGLSEHFLYSNDDMFFGRPVRPELFFSPGGVSSFVECGVRIGPGPARPSRSGHDNALRVNRDLLKQRFGRTIVRDLEHCATPLRRSIMFELEREFPAEFARTASSRFRSATDISVTNSLYHYYAQFTGRAISSTAPRVGYVQTTTAAGLRRMERLSKVGFDMFCLNDGAETEVPEALRVQAVTDLLERLFPVRAPWETISAERGRAERLA